MYIYIYIFIYVKIRQYIKTISINIKKEKEKEQKFLSIREISWIYQRNIVKFDYICNILSRRLG